MSDEEDAPGTWGNEDEPRTPYIPIFFSLYSLQRAYVTCLPITVTSDDKW